ncbi:MAG: class I SAM-dependent methyltransferase [Candidatus Tectomicrobia bacterium]
MDKDKTQQFMMKVVGDVGASVAAGLVFIGDRVGLFQAMASAGPLRLDEVVAKTGLQARYVEEWLGGMVSAAYLTYDPEAQTYTLPDEHAFFLASQGTDHYLGGLFKGLPGLLSVAPKVATAFEQGGGVAFQDYGADFPLTVEHMNRGLYEQRLVQSWLPTMPEVVETLQRGGSALDIGCGTGIVPILLAKAFPQARVAGLDIDQRSIEIARDHAQEAELGDRVTFTVGSAKWLPDMPQYDFISTFDCVHDLVDPLGTLKRIRNILAPGGTYLMVEPNVADRLEDTVNNPFASMLYGISVLHCLTQSLAHDGAGLGACWGETKARELVQEAGFSHFERLNIRSPVQLFYEIKL